MMRRAGFILLSGLFLVLGLQTPAQAHAVLTKTNPVANSVVQEAPKQIVLTFSESITPVNEKIRVIGPDGKRADNGKITAEGRCCASAWPTIRPAAPIWSASG